MTSYSDYVQHYIPPEKQPLLDAVLDQGHDTAKDLNEIARYPTRWEQQLSHHLELTKEEIDDINEIRDPTLRRRRVLQVWKDKKRLNATYGKLLNVCILGGDTRTATKICELVAQKPLPQKSPATPQATPMAHPPVPPGQPQVGYSGYPTSSGQPVGHPSGYGVYLANSGQPPSYLPQAQMGYPPNLQHGMQQQFIPQGQGYGGGYMQGPPPPGGYGSLPSGSFPPGAFPQNSTTHLSSGQVQPPGSGSSAQQSALSAQVPPVYPEGAAASAVPRQEVQAFTQQGAAFAHVPQPQGAAMVKALKIEVATNNVYKQNMVECDGVDKTVQYEAYDRGKHLAQLKLHDDAERTTEMQPNPYKQVPKPQKYYKMTSAKHGVCLIINNRMFKDPKHKERVGTERDEYNLIETSYFLGYRPVVMNNLTSTEIRDVFKNLDSYLMDSNNKARAKVANDSFMCCILSHGNEDSIIGSDSEGVKREEIEKLAGESEILNSKPKIFFLQACRGSGQGTEPTPRVEPDASGSKRADFYICFATVHGDQSYRDPITGSWFVTEVCKILCEYATCERLNSEFQLRLNTNVSNNLDYQCKRDDGKFYVQQPTCSNQLQHHVHFFDGYI